MVRIFNRIFGSSIKRQAAYWVVRLGSSDCLPDELNACREWCRANPRHKPALQKAQLAMDTFDLVKRDPALIAMARSAERKIKPRRRWVTLVPSTAGAIGALALLVYAVFPVNVRTGELPDSQTINASAKYETAVGEQSIVTLIDGSRITLNTNTRILTAFKNSERQVTLEHGQAIFDVAKDPNRPFVVYAGSQQVTALGTSFDVSLSENSEVNIILVEGRVAVTKIGSTTADTEPQTETNVTSVQLTAGQQLIARNDDYKTIDAQDLEELTSWRHGRLVFRDMPLQNTIDQINRYSLDRISLTDDPELSSIAVNGVFNIGSPATFIEAISTLHPIQATRLSPLETQLSFAREPRGIR